jgi:hypothetical protein
VNTHLLYGTDKDPPLTWELWIPTASSQCVCLKLIRTFWCCAWRHSASHITAPFPCWSTPFCTKQWYIFIMIVNTSSSLLFWEQDNVTDLNTKMTSMHQDLASMKEAIAYNFNNLSTQFVGIVYEFSHLSDDMYRHFDQWSEKAVSSVVEKVLEVHTSNNLSYSFVSCSFCLGFLLWSSQTCHRIISV